MRRITPRLAGFIAALLVGVFYAAEVGSLDGVLHIPGSGYTDLLITHWPNAYFFQQSVWRDHCWPLWNPLIFSGTPFAANPLSGVWYPPNWIFLVLPITPGFNLLLVGHLMLGAAGAARLVDRLQTGSARSWVGPLVGGLAWGLAPKTWGSLGAGHVGVVYALAWLPWITDAGVVQLRARERRIPYRVSVLWALQFLADPRVAAYTVLLLVGLVCWHLFRHSRAARLAWPGTRDVRRLMSDLVPWASAGVAAAGLAAAQWLPLADLLPHTTRASLVPEESALYSLPISHLAAIIWPRRGGFHEWMIYMGIGVLWLAIIGWLTRARSIRNGALVACCLLAVLTLGDNGPLYWLLVKLPGASLLRVPPRVWHLVVLCLAILAGLGAGELSASSEALLSQRHNVRRFAMILTAFTGLLGAGVWVLVPGSAARIGALWAFVWLVLAIIVSEVAMTRRSSPHVVGIAFVFIVAIDLLWVDSSLVEQIPVAEAYAEDFRVAGRLGPLGGRIYAPSFRPSQHVLASVGLRVVNGVDPLHLADYSHFLNAAAGVEAGGGYSVALPPLPENAEPTTALAQSKPDPVLLSLLDVRAIVSRFALDESLPGFVSLETADDLNVYRNESAIPWPVVFQRVEVVSDLDEALEAIEDKGGDKMAVVSGGYALDGPTGYQPAALLSLTPNRLLIKAVGPGLLVVSEVVDPGWRARVDGEDAKIHPTDGILRGVYLPEGDHTVEMIYRPPAIFWGLGVSIAALGGLVVAYRRSRRRHG